MTTPARLYRSLLRELPPRPILARPPSHLHQRIRDSFSAPADGTTAPRATAEAEQFLAYLRAQRQHGILLDRYNPGLNLNDEERVRLAARRVGLNLPVEFESGKQ